MHDMVVSKTDNLPPVPVAVPYRRPVNLRSVLLGLLGVVLICGLTAYNDYVVSNTYLVGNFLPIGLLLFMVSFILLINTPLTRWAPRRAFTTGELGVALCMMLVSCAIPSSGMMRYLPGHLVGLWPKATENVVYADALTEANLPDWLFPTMARTGIRDRANDPVVRDFMGRVPLTQDSFVARFRAVPWKAWAVPTFTWGVLVCCIFGAVLCVSVVFRRQWVENERLPYPLATVYLSLIEQPKPGSLLNPLFGSRTFWIAFATVFAIHAINALRLYDPKVWPEIPLGYNFFGIMGNPPLSYAEWSFKAARVFFCMVGITYFLQSNVAFSIWFFYILTAVVARCVLGTYQADLTEGMGNDQTIGAAVPYTLTMLWIARKHLLLVARQMFRKPEPDEAQGRYLPYFLAGWGTVVFAAGIVAWLCVVGVSFLAAVGILLICGMLYLVVARVLAETGLIFIQVPGPVTRPFNYLAQSLPAALAHKVSVRSFFFAGMFNSIFVHDQRESIAGFLPQALRVADGAAYEGERNWRKVLPFTFCIVGALIVGYFVAGTGMLYTEYSYTATLDHEQGVPINPYGVRDAVTGQTLDPVRDFRANGGPTESHNRGLHLAVGATTTTVLSALRLRFVSWPLHPVGYILTYSYAIKTIWFSVFIGWLAKLLIVKFGGASLYRSVKPLFLGLIMGEVGAAAFWLIVSLTRSSMGLTYHAVRLLPG